MNILKKVVTHCIYSQGLLSPRKERSIDFFLYDLKEKKHDSANVAMQRIMQGTD
jgi:hypothetical protein